MQDIKIQDMKVLELYMADLAYTGNCMRSSDETTGNCRLTFELKIKANKSEIGVKASNHFSVL